MLNLENHKKNGKVSLKSLTELREKTLQHEAELRDKLFQLRGVQPKPDHYVDMRNEMSQVKEILEDIANCFNLYEQYGNISYNEVVNDCGFETAKKRAERLDQEWYEENSQTLKGWYNATVDYCAMDIHKGGHKEKTLNGKVLADSPLDAYNKACREIESKGGFWPEPPTSALIEYIGVLTDDDI